MPAIPFSKTGTAPENTSWDWSAATQNKILGDSEDDWTKYKAAHAWWDGSTGDDAAKKAPYKLPHHQMGDSGLEAVWHGVTAAMGRLESADIPDSEMKAVFDHLASHYAQWDKTPPEWDRFVKRVETRRAPHAALPLGTTRAIVKASRMGGRPLDGDLLLINQKARTPLNAEQVYVIPMQNSDNSIDSYFTRMTPATLHNYAMDATNGVAFCDSHQHYQMPIGRSFLGQVSNDGAAMYADTVAYMLRGMTLPGGMRSDDYIQGMEGGIYHDVSVGFDPQHYWCSICQLDMLNDWDCNHWPGRVYEQKDGGEIQCIADVDAHLIENSLVYKGANENAALLPNADDDGGGRSFSNILLLKTEVEVTRGRATLRDFRYVEDRCHVRLFQRYSGYTPTQQRDEDMKGHEFVQGIIDADERGGKEISTENMAKLQTICTDLQKGHDTMGDAMKAMMGFMTEKGAADPDGDPAADGGGDSGIEGNTQKATPPPVTRDDPPPLAPTPAEPATPVERLTPDERAAMSFAARAKDEAIQAALREGVRALGEKFDPERYRAILERADFDEIRAFQRDWETVTAQVLSGRGTWDERTQTWSNEPTGRGGRQTAPRSPSDPAGLGTAAKPSLTRKIVSTLYKTN